MSESLFPGLDDLEPPALHRVLQSFPRPRVDDVAGAVTAQISRPEVAATLSGARTAAVAVPGSAPADIRMVRIRDTLNLSEIAVSGNLLSEMSERPECEVLGPWEGWS